MKRNVLTLLIESGGDEFAPYAHCLWLSLAGFRLISFTSTTLAAGLCTVHKHPVLDGGVGAQGARSPKT